MRGAAYERMIHSERLAAFAPCPFPPLGACLGKGRVHSLMSDAGAVAIVGIVVVTIALLCSVSPSTQ